MARKASVPPGSNAPGGTTFEDYNKIAVPIPALRMMLAELQKSGVTEMPLGNLLHMIADLIKREQHD